MLNITSPLISPSPGDPDCLVLGPVPAPQLMGLQLQTALIVTDDVSTTGKSDDLSPHVLFNFEFQCGDRLQGRDSKSLTGT